MMQTQREHLIRQALHRKTIYAASKQVLVEDIGYLLQQLTAERAKLPELLGIATTAAFDAGRKAERDATDA